jgi:hypothetical protein
MEAVLAAQHRRIGAQISVSAPDLGRAVPFDASSPFGAFSSALRWYQGWCSATNHTKRIAMNDSRLGDLAGDAVDEAKGRVSAAAQTGSELAGRARTSAAEAGGAIQNAAVEAVRQIGDAAAEAYRQGVQVSKSVSQNTAEQPFLALLIAGAIGFGVAYMIFRRWPLALIGIDPDLLTGVDPLMVFAHGR